MHSRLMALAAVLFLGLSANWASPAAEDFVLKPTGNPFVPVELEKESIAAKMRHPFHKMRTVWDRYFRVYESATDDCHSTTLGTIRSEPSFFLHRKVEFDIYYYKRGAFYRQFVSCFHRDTDANFSCWTHGAEIWNLEARQDIFPCLYVDLKDRADLIQKLDALEPFTPVHVWGTVEIIGEGYPFISLVAAEPIEETKLNLSVLRDLELAFKRMEKKDWPLAITAFEACLRNELSPAVQAKVWEGLGICRIEQRQYQMAREALIAGLKVYGNPRIQLTEALLKNPVCIKSLTMLADCDTRIEGLAPEGIQAAGLVLKLEPTHATARALRGVALAESGDVRGGLTEVDAAQRLAPKGQLLDIYRSRGRIFVLLARWAEAKAEFEKAILARPEDVAAHLSLGDVYMATKSYKDAQREYELAGLLAPDWPEPPYRLALAQKALGDVLAAEKKDDEAGKQYAAALKSLAACHARDDRYAPAYGFHAELLRALGKSDEARRLMNDAVQGAPQSPAMQEMLITQAEKTGDWAAREKACALAADMQPDNAALQLRLGDVRATLPKPDYLGAELAYARAALLDPEMAPAWVGLTDMRRRLSKWSLGLGAGERAVSLKPTSFLAWTDLAECYRQAGDKEKSLDAAERAFGLENNVTSRVNLALAYLESGQPAQLEKALPLARLAAKEARGDMEKAAAKSVLGAVLVQQGQASEAKALFAESAKQLSEDPWFSLWQGRCQLQTSDFSAARASFRKAAAQARADMSGSAAMERIAKDADKGLGQVEDAEKESSAGRAPQIDSGPAKPK